MPQVGRPWDKVYSEIASGIVETIVQGRISRMRVPDRRFGVVLKVNTTLEEHTGERLEVYGSRSVYAVAKRQLSRRELRTHGLRGSAGTRTLARGPRS